jgi:hypothetical protein
MAKAYNASWTRNEKLAKTSRGAYNVVGFGTVADHDFIDADGEKRNTCTGASACKAVCYAKQGAYVFPVVRKARMRNLRMTMKKNFAARIVADLLRMRAVNTVRIHDAGDFYSQEYLEKWYEIARALPHLTFYAYTKSLHLDFSKRPKNLHITQSLGGKYDKLVQLRRPHARIFASHKDRMAAGYKDGNRSDIPAIEGVRKIGLVYHGNKDLTPAQKKFFS